MNFTRLVITDGRTDMLADMLASFAWYYEGPPLATIIVDDSGDRTVPTRERVYELCPDAQILIHPERLGLAQAIRTGWAHLPPDGYVIHLEDDCVFTADIDLPAWIYPLQRDLNVQQVVLQRGPNNDEEHAHGGILKWWKAQGVLLSQHQDIVGATWVTHQHLFSLQPNIYRASLARHGWPEHGGEREFTDLLLRNLPQACFAYLGTPNTEPVYEHVGYARRTPGWVL